MALWVGYLVVYVGARGRGPVSRRVQALALAAVALVIGAALGATQRPVQSSNPATSEMTAERSILEIHVAGWVVSPGVVAVAEGSIVADAVEAAGGMRPGASADLINLAAPLRSGDQIVVPGPHEEVGGGDGSGLIQLNRANATELEELPGVGPVLAERIVLFREENGPFSQVEDLLQVPGIGESKLGSIRDLVRVP